MHSIVLYQHVSNGEEAFEYNFYDHKFAPTNLIVRKVLMAMMDSTRQHLTHLEIEYNDGMLVEKLGKKAVDTLQLLGASKANLKENKSGEVTYSRTFTAELTPERYEFMYLLPDVATFSRYRLLEGEQERVIFHFNQYLLLRIPQSESELFYTELQKRTVPYQVKALD